MGSNKHLQDLCRACSHTQNLWQGSEIKGIEQFEWEFEKDTAFSRSIVKKLRLGQLAEQFIFNQIESSDELDLVAENIQIKDDTRTLGELDAIIKHFDHFVHLEIVYKFYVYDHSQGPGEIDFWIGPNRKDSLVEKLKKLQEKQFQILYNTISKAYLQSLRIDINSIVQRVLFKAQLFVPYKSNIVFDKLNPNCVKGFYIHIDQLDTFKDHVFYIPSKHEWFLEANDTVSWQNYFDFKLNVQTHLSEKQSPMFWIKSNAENLQKGFLVWW